MIPENLFSGQNLLLNSSMEVNQRFGKGGPITNVDISFTTDLWRLIATRTDTQALDNGISFEHDLVVKPNQFDVGSARIGRASSGPNTNFLRFEQRVEDIYLTRISESKMLIQAKIKRDPGLTDTGIKVQFAVQVALAGNNYVTANRDVDDFDIILEPLKVGGVSLGDLTMANISSSEFETFFATFDVPTNAQLGMAVSILFVKDAGDPIANEFICNLSEVGFHRGSILPAFKTATAETTLSEFESTLRYYCKSQRKFTAVGTGGLGTSYGIGTAQSSTAVFTNVRFPVSMAFETPLVFLYDNSNNVGRIHRLGVADHANNCTAGSINNLGFPVINSSGLVTTDPNNIYAFQWAAESPL